MNDGSLRGEFGIGKDVSKEQINTESVPEVASGGGSELDIKVDKEGNGSAYDAALRKVRGGIHTKWKIITKKKGTTSGNPLVMIQIGDETAVVTARQFLEAAAMIGGAHLGCGERSWPDPEKMAGMTISGFHRGVKWTGLLIDRMYLVTAESAKGKLSLAGDEKSAKGCGESLIDHSLVVGRG